MNISELLRQAFVGTNILYLTITSNTDPFDKLAKNNIIDNKNLRQTSTAIGIIGIAGSIIVCGIILATTKDARKRNEAKSHFVTKGVIAVIIFAFIWLIGQIMSITTQLV